MAALTTRLRGLLSPRLILLSAFGSTSALNYVFGLAMGWLLLPGDFGLLAFAQTVGLTAGLVLHYGVPASLTASIVGASGRARAPLVRGAVLANLGVAVVMAAAILGLYAFGPLRPGFESWSVVLIVALSLPFVALISVAWGTAQGSEHFGALATIVVVEVLCKAIAGVGLVLAGEGVRGAIGGLLVGAVVGAAVSAYYLIARLGIGPSRSVHLPSLRATGAMFGSMLGLVLLLNLDLVGLKLFAADDRRLTGYYQAGIILANAPYYLVTSTIVTVLFTQVARMREIRATPRLVGEALATTAVLVVPIEVLLALAPDIFLRLFFPASYAPGAAALRLLAIGNALLIAVVVLTTAFQATGRARVPAVILLAIAALEPLTLWLAVPRWEIVGAAGVFVTVSAVALLSLSAAYLRALGLPAGRGAASWVSKYALALAVAAAAGLATSSLDESRVIALVAGGAAYLAAGVALGLIHDPRLLARQPSRAPRAARGGED